MLVSMVLIHKICVKNRLNVFFSNNYLDLFYLVWYNDKTYWAVTDKVMLFFQDQYEIIK